MNEQQKNNTNKELLSEYDKKISALNSQIQDK